jgi:hypothetical protein
LIDTRQSLQSIQPTFPETGILFYSTGALKVNRVSAKMSLGALSTKVSKTQGG